MWWFGEGLGSVLTGNASPVNGAPGSAPLLALLAVAFWPAARWRRRPTDVDSDGMHVVMGVAMAGMLVTGLRFGPAGAWEAVFAAAAGWFGWRFVRLRRGARVSPWRCPQPVPHLVECGAMVYMYLAVPRQRRPGRERAAGIRRADDGYCPGGRRAGNRGGRLARRRRRAGLRRPYLAPRCAALCKIAMGITMGYTLILLLSRRTRIRPLRRRRAARCRRAPVRR